MCQTTIVRHFDTPSKDKNIDAVPNMQKMQFGTAFDYLIEEKKKKLYKQKIIYHEH